MSSRGQTSEGESAIAGMQDDVNKGKTAGGASIQNTEQNSPPSPSGGKCGGVPARPQREQKKNTHCVLVPKHRWISWAAHPA